jgi:hypothetical protein
MVCKACDRQPITTFDLDGRSRSDHDEAAVDIRERKVLDTTTPR